MSHKFLAKNIIFILFLLSFSINAEEIENKITKNQPLTINGELTQEPIRHSGFEVMAEIIPPLSYYDNIGNLAGIEIDVIQAIFKRLNYSQEIKIYPWFRAYKKLQNGKNKVLIGVARNPDREKMFKWVGPFHTEDVYFYRKNSSKLIIDTLEDAKKVGNIAVVRGFPEHEILLKNDFQNTHDVTSPDIAIKLLAKGRVDLFAIGEYVFEYLIQQAHIDPQTIQKTNLKIINSNIYIAFSKDSNDQEVHKWQQALNELKTTEIFKKIEEKYIVRMLVP